MFTVYRGGYSFYKEQIKNNEGVTVKNLISNQTVLNQNSGKTIKIDACGIQCPGPILKISDEIKKIHEGDIVEVSTADAGFASDIQAWCESTGNTLLNISKENRIIKASVQKGALARSQADTSTDGQTIVVFSNDFDKVMASFIIANGAAASGKPVTMFFTFWGLNVLRKSQFVNVKKNLIEKMFGWMMPKGAEELSLSKMNMGGLGSIMMKTIMKNKNILSLKELIQTAQKSGVKFIACSMSMDVMGIKAEELIEGVEIGGVAKYIAEANQANSNLFI